MQTFVEKMKLVEAATNSFISSKDQDTKEFYAITLSPLESKIHSEDIWYDIDARERLISTLWNQVKHHLNRNLHNNYWTSQGLLDTS